MKPLRRQSSSSVWYMVTFPIFKSLPPSTGFLQVKTGHQKQLGSIRVIKEVSQYYVLLTVHYGDRLYSSRSTGTPTLSLSLRLLLNARRLFSVCVQPCATLRSRLVLIHLSDLMLLFTLSYIYIYIYREGDRDIICRESKTKRVQAERLCDISAHIRFAPCGLREK